MRHFSYKTVSLFLSLDFKPNISNISDLSWSIYLKMVNTFAMKVLKLNLKVC